MKFPDFEIPIKSDTTFVCYACCTNGSLDNVDGQAIWDCPDHMRVTFGDKVVSHAESRGTRH